MSVSADTGQPEPPQIDHHLQLELPAPAHGPVILSDLIGVTSRALVAGVSPAARITIEGPSRGPARGRRVDFDWTTPPEPLPPTPAEKLVAAVGTSFDATLAGLRAAFRTR